MIPVIIFDGGVNGLGAVRSLGRSGIKTFVLTNEENAISAHSKYTNFVKTPNIKDDKNFINFLIRFGKKFKGAILSPDSDPAILLISKNYSKLKKYFKIPLPSSFDLVNTLVNKEKFYKFAIKKNLPIPKTFFPLETDIKKISEQLTYPCILKPIDSYHFFIKFGTKIIEADSKHSLIKKYNYIKNYQKVFIQEKIPGEDSLLYTFGSYCNKKSETVAYFTARKIRQYPVIYGHCSYGQSIENSDLVSLSKEILKTYRYHGISQIEFKKDPRDQKFKLLEINARSWSWHHLSTTCGVNLHLTMYNDLLDIRMPNLKQTKQTYGWLYLYKDILSIFQQNPGILNWLRSLQGSKEYAIYASDDLRPFFREITNKIKRILITLFK